MQQTATGWCCISFIDQDEFEAIKTLNGHRALHCDEHQFCAKITVITLTIFEISLLNLINMKESTQKMVLLLYTTHHFCI